MPENADGDHGGESEPDGATDDTGDLPADVVDEAERLTRLARNAVDEAEREAYRRERDAVLDEHGYVARVRTDDEVLVCYPDEWVEDGVVDPADVEDVDRGVERPLTGPADVDWETAHERNETLADRVAEEYGPDHAANVRALGEFLSNHYRQPIDSATAPQLREFRDEYYPRNVWPSDRQKQLLGESIELAFTVADERPPTGWTR
jgi:hypothetical protein